MFVPASIRRALPAAVALVALLTSAGTAAAGAEPPNYPRAVPAAPGALTGTHPRTPSDLSAALAAERSYSSYGEPRPDDAAVADGRGGIGVAPFVLALSGALVIGFAAGGLASPARARRRHRVEIAS